jgi:uncharacterized membrane protein
MDTFVVAVFPTEEKAYEGKQVLKDLQAAGDIVLYAMSVVTRGADGKLRVDEAATPEPIGPIVTLACTPVIWAALLSISFLA